MSNHRLTLMERYLKDYPALDFRIKDNILEIGKKQGQFGFHVYYEYPLEEKLETPTASFQEEDSKKDNDFRSWLHLQGINDYLTAEPLEDIQVLHSNGKQVIWKLKESGEFYQIQHSIGNKVTYWAELKFIPDTKGSYFKYINSRGVEVQKIWNAQKNIYIYQWIKGKPFIDYGKKRFKPN